MTGPRSVSNRKRRRKRRQATHGSSQLTFAVLFEIESFQGLVLMFVVRFECVFVVIVVHAVVDVGGKIFVFSKLDLLDFEIVADWR